MLQTSSQLWLKSDQVRSTPPNFGQDLDGVEPISARIAKSWSNSGHILADVVEIWPNPLPESDQTWRGSAKPARVWSSLAKMRPKSGKSWRASRNLCPSRARFGPNRDEFGDQVHDGVPQDIAENPQAFSDLNANEHQHDHERAPRWRRRLEELAASSAEGMLEALAQDARRRESTWARCGMSQHMQPSKGRRRVRMGPEGDDTDSGESRSTLCYPARQPHIPLQSRISASRLPQLCVVCSTRHESCCCFTRVKSVGR